MKIRAVLIFLVVFYFKSFGTSSCAYKKLHDVDGNAKIALVVRECGDTPTKTALTQTYVNSAIWTTLRLNVLNFTGPILMGITIYQSCTEEDDLRTLFQIYESSRDYFVPFIVFTSPVSSRVTSMSNALQIEVVLTEKNTLKLVEASAKLLEALDWKGNITVVSENVFVFKDFFHFTKKKWMCVKKAFLADKFDEDISKNVSGPLVIFDKNMGDKNIAVDYGITSEERQVIFIPLDGSQPHDLPNGSYLIQPVYSEPTKNFTNSPKIIPSPMLIEVSIPIITAAQAIASYLEENCNDTDNKSSCLREKISIQWKQRIKPFVNTQDVLSVLKIQPLHEKFAYNIYRVENFSWTRQDQNNSLEFYSNSTFQTFMKVFSYGFFNDKFVDWEAYGEAMNFSNVSLPSQLCSEDIINCLADCVNLKLGKFHDDIFLPHLYDVHLRSEAWVLALLSLSLLGIIFCVAIMAFLILRIFKKDVLEGNPALTILLLVTVIAMYGSTIPFALESEKSSKSAICLARALSVTLTYSLAFSLVLSRSILLATISKEVGFMSHVPGTVQSFLTLFIFAVQGALSLQFFQKCDDIFKGVTFIYLVSYNIILLMLLISVCPLIFRSQRNYREGRYFTIASFLISIVWSCWIPGYALLGEEWNDPMICFGVVATASIFVGAVFIPRTYLMTISATRDRLTSALPSLATATSAIDIYRASTQPIYDCVNVAAINAATLARASYGQDQSHPDFYSAPAVLDEDDFEIDRCLTPTSPDKITRF